MLFSSISCVYCFDDKIGHFCVCPKPLFQKLILNDFFILFQIKLIFTRKVLYLASNERPGNDWKGVGLNPTEIGLRSSTVLIFHFTVHGKLHFSYQYVFKLPVSKGNPFSNKIKAGIHRNSEKIMYSGVYNLKVPWVCTITLLKSTIIQ